MGGENGSNAPSWLLQPKLKNYCCWPQDSTGGRGLNASGPRGPPSIVVVFESDCLMHGHCAVHEVRRWPCGHIRVILTYYVRTVWLRLRCSLICRSNRSPFPTAARECSIVSASASNAER